MGACAVWFYLAMLGTKRECVRVAKHHLFGHSLKGASFLFQHFGQADAVGICCRAAHWVVPPFLKWPCCVCSQTRLGPGPRQRRRQVQEEGSLPSERSGEGGAKRRSAQAKRGRLGWQCRDRIDMESGHRYCDEAARSLGFPRSIAAWLNHSVTNSSTKAAAEVTSVHALFGRTRRNETEEAPGDGPLAERNRGPPSTPRSSLSAIQASCRGFYRWLRV